MQYTGIYAFLQTTTLSNKTAKCRPASKGTGRTTLSPIAVKPTSSQQIKQLKQTENITRLTAHR